MKILSLVLALFLLLIMGISGSISAKIAYELGQEAIKGVKQPESNPLKKLGLNNVNNNNNNQKSKFISEKEILVKVYDFVYYEGNIPGKDNNNNEDGSFISIPGEEEKSPFPVSTTDENVVMTVERMTRQGGALLLDLSLTNKSTEKVEFLYSFMDIRDPQNRALSGITDGLPRQIPPNGQAYSGTVRIPISLLETSEKISLSLTDYPSQEVNLTIMDIPIPE